MTTERTERGLRLFGEISSPPFTLDGKKEAFQLLRLLQLGASLGLPESRPMPIVGSKCHELRIRDAEHNWRIIYHLAPEAVVVLGIFPKKTQRTPKGEIGTCQDRLKRYLAEFKKGKK